MTMTPEARRALSTTIRGLRTYLLEALRAAVETEYRFVIARVQDAGLDEVRAARRRRFEQWMAEQVRADGAGQKKKTASQKKTRSRKKASKKKTAAEKSATAGKQAGRTAEDFRREAEKQAAYTLLNRLVLLRLMEASGLRSPHVVTGGWTSPGYRDFREFAPALVRDDPTEGYAFLLKLVFEDLAQDLPGLYGPAGIAELVPIGPAVLRGVVEALDDQALESCWTDDMTLGWIYQYWNDPEREALDAKLNSGGKVEPHEIASKTQMFTERYMVDWLLQNSLGPMWLAMCRKHGWTAACEAPGPDGQSVLDVLEARRVAWRAKREAGEVELTELMPLHSDMERRWAFYVPQAIPEDAVASAPDTVRSLKILDPAVGSGHFLMVAFDLLFALYQEEARHRGEDGEDHAERWNDRTIVESIVENNLHGIDLDPRAVQIAAAALWLKIRQTCATAEPRRLNLVASNLHLASLPDDDPALVELREQVERETGIPGELTGQIVEALAGANHLGSLLKVDAAVDEAIAQHERALSAAVPDQGHLFDGFGPERREAVPVAQARAGIVERLERFLEKRGAKNDLGLRLRGEQLARGVRFLRLVREGGYDLVVGNPPYQGTSKMSDPGYVQKRYPLGKADLYAAFILRGLELVRQGGVSALLTMRNWMFIKQYAALRDWLLATHDLQALGDFDRGAFEEVPDEVVSVVVSVFRTSPSSTTSVAQCPTPRDDTSRDSERTQRKRAATLCHVGRHEFDPAALKVVPEWPLVYWWDYQIVLYKTHKLIGSVSPIRKGLCTGNDDRYTRRAWEPRKPYLLLATSYSSAEQELPPSSARWVPIIMGGKGRAWMEPVVDLMQWGNRGLENRVMNEWIWGSYTKRVQSESYYFRRGVAFTMIGATFAARAHRFISIFGNKGSSVFPDDIAATLCLMNSSWARGVLQSLNPGVGYEVGDVARLPVVRIQDGCGSFGTTFSSS